MAELEYTPGALSSLISNNKKNKNVVRELPNSSKASKKSQKRKIIIDEENNNSLFKSRKLPCKTRKDSSLDKCESSNTNTDDEQLTEENFEVLSEYQPKKILSKREKIATRRAENESNSGRTVFIGNAPTGTTAKDMRKIFLPFGTLEAVYERSLLKKNIKRTKQLLGADRKEKSIHLNSTNFFVRFNTEIDAKKAAEKINGQEFRGYFLRVTMSVQKEFGRSTSIFVGNLPYEAEEDEVRKHFLACGDIKSVRIVHDKNTGRCVGIGYIEFADKNAREAAVQMNNQEFNGRPLRIARVLRKNDKRKRVSEKGNSRLLRGQRRKMRKTEQIALDKIPLEKLAEYSNATDRVHSSQLRLKSVKENTGHTKKFNRNNKTAKGKKVSLMATT